MLIWWLTACLQTPEPKSRDEPHYEEWPRLVEAVALGRHDQVGAYARDLMGPEEEALGAALGWLQVATPEERVEALDLAAAACRGCHAARGVVVAGSQGTQHKEAAAWLARGMLGARQGPLSLPDGPQASADVQRCLTCHTQAPAPATPPPLREAEVSKAGGGAGSD